MAVLDNFFDQFHAINLEYFTDPVNDLPEYRINILTVDITQIEKEIKTVLRDNLDIERNYILAKSVTGIGLVNAVMSIFFTNSFSSITDSRKYACYSGIDPFEHSSVPVYWARRESPKFPIKGLKLT